MGISDPSQPSTIRIWHDPANPSSLALGLLQIGGVSTPYPTCNTLVAEPCRTNPLPVPPGAGPDGGTASRQTIPPAECTAWQTLTIRIPTPRRAERVKSVRIYLARKLVRRITGKDLKQPVSLKLAGYSGPRVQLAFTFTTTHGSLTVRRSYPSCRTLW